jgi:hypothetical protein
MEGEMAAVQAEIQTLTRAAIAGGGRRLAGGRRGSVPRSGLVPWPPPQTAGAAYLAIQRDLQANIRGNAAAALSVEIPSYALVAPGPASAPPAFPTSGRTTGDRMRRATAPTMPSPPTRPTPSLPPLSARGDKPSLSSRREPRPALAQVLHVGASPGAGFVRAASELTIGEGGWLVQKVQRNFGLATFRAAMTGEAMTRGRHCADFQLLNGVAGVMVGVSREWLDPTRGESILHTDDGWGFDACNGDLIHGSAGPGDWKWEGQQACVQGDTIGLELDCDAGTLAVSRNGVRLGTITKRLTVGLKHPRTAGRNMAGGLIATSTAGGLVWVVQLMRQGQAVRVAIAPPAGGGRQMLTARQHRRGSVPAVFEQQAPAARQRSEGRRGSVLTNVMMHRGRLTGRQRRHSQRRASLPENRAER